MFPRTFHIDLETLDSLKQKFEEASISYVLLDDPIGKDAQTAMLSYCGREYRLSVYQFNKESGFAEGGIRMIDEDSISARTRFNKKIEEFLGEEPVGVQRPITITKSLWWGICLFKGVGIILTIATVIFVILGMIYTASLLRS